jgi:YVTN family beta-propeller protein
VVVNPATNKIYVANYNSNNVTVFDGSTNSDITVAAGTKPSFLAVNPITNKIYVANSGSNDVSVINGATNNTETISVGASPSYVLVNSVTDKIYILKTSSNIVTVIEGTTNSTSTITAGTNPYAIALNPLTNITYVANYGGNVTVIKEQEVESIPLTTVISPLTDNTSFVGNPTLSYAAASAYSPVATSVQKVYYQVDTWTGPWNTATPSGGNGNFTIPVQPAGIHTVYAFAGDGQEATSINTGFSSSPIPGAMAAYTLLVSCTLPGSPTVVIASAGNAQASVTFTPPQSNGGAPITAYTVTSSPGNVTGTGTESPIIVAGLTNGITYSFTVTATNAAGIGPESTHSNSVTPNSAAYALNVSVDGKGSGSVQSVPGGISCSSGTCSHDFTADNTIRLEQSPSNGSQFAGWSGNCVGLGPCDVLMSSPRNVTATFNLIPYAMIHGVSQLYGLLQSAYNAASDGAVIEAQEGIFFEDLNMGDDKNVTIRGGYTDAIFSIRNGITKLHGKLTIELGSLTADLLAIE